MSFSEECWKLDQRLNFVIFLQRRNRDRGGCGGAGVETTVEEEFVSTPATGSIQQHMVDGTSPASGIMGREQEKVQQRCTILK